MSNARAGRRAVLTAMFSCAGAAAALALTPRTAAARPGRAETGASEPQQPPVSLGLVADAPYDQSASLQRAIDYAAISGAPLVLPAGTIRAGRIRLQPGLTMTGAGARSRLELLGAGPLLQGDGVHGLRLQNFSLSGASETAGRGGDAGLLELRDSRGIELMQLTVSASMANGIVLARCGGTITRCNVSRSTLAALYSIDATGMSIDANQVSDCANNGILVWRSSPGEDGTRITGNRISGIRAAAGGTGQNGNGINVFRAAGVQVIGNQMSDCAYSAVRANAASNVQIVSNKARRIGEVALYVEFGFEGALVAQNLVDGAAAGISVTNFNEGGRLAVVQGNLIRNLHRREFEPVDKRGEGISVEADASVSGNTIEGAPTTGIVIGWGPYMRDVAVTGNVIRKSGIGIAVSRHADAGAALLAQNIISGAARGAIRFVDNGVPAGEDLTRVPPAARRILVRDNLVVDNET